MRHKGFVLQWTWRSLSTLGKAFFCHPLFCSQTAPFVDVILSLTPGHLLSLYFSFSFPSVCPTNPCNAETSLTEKCLVWWLFSNAIAVRSSAQPTQETLGKMHRWKYMHNISSQHSPYYELKMGQVPCRNASNSGPGPWVCDPWYKTCLSLIKTKQYCDITGKSLLHTTHTTKSTL